jgi:hypothetical protein
MRVAATWEKPVPNQSPSRPFLVPFLTRYGHRIGVFRTPSPPYYFMPPPAFLFGIC